MAIEKIKFIKCLEHDELCFFKTCSTDGPKFGKSYYICSNKNTCKFIIRIEDKIDNRCVNHNAFIDLCKISLNHRQPRQYFRCIIKKAQDGKWCGLIERPDLKYLKTEKSVLFNVFIFKKSIRFCIL
ncbi:hypothetical protein A3Q56_07935 [Intoshia linei]|uniref:GRF-type domain-containing protein n=1 Tax=Intoshia linei TaxID=1819745 RepID=A0A177AQU2_9BILA|nr:hypothetical protein A3Q56_07935 [Intoshia linei]